MREAKRYLIVNADDFGISPATNRGIVQAHEKGIVTSASLMTRYPAARDAAAYARAHPEMTLGLHFDIGEWAYREGQWVQLHMVVEPDDAAGIESELQRQFECFRELVGDDPTHLDSHQHVHREEPTRSIMLRAAQALGVPLRQCSAHVRYDGRFYGQASHGEPWPRGISIAGLLEILSGLFPGLTELGCHPGLDLQLDSPYRLERTREVETLCDARTRMAVRAHAIELVSFREVNRWSGPDSTADALLKT
jgi:predicted glycoside hydrolase/deacetylase ChbG (UPF0249 family)